MILPSARLRSSSRFPGLRIAALLLLAAAPVGAHKPSDSYLKLQVSGARVEGSWDIALRDLDSAVGLDEDDDGAITWGELKHRGPAVAAYALSRLQLASGGASCPSQQGGLRVDTHSDGAYAVLSFVAECPGPVRELNVRYALLFDQDPLHRGLLQLTTASAVRTAIFSPETSRQSFDLAPGGGDGLAQLGAFVKDGVHHIWSGLDHVLFLLALLLPAVLRREGGRWLPAPRFAPALAEVLKVVTSFTVAHSITLSLAALDVVHLPSRLVESAIALSVLLAALNNLWPVLRGRAWPFAFGFGLLHGFGFAVALADLHLPRAGLVRALLGFNLGVELGQLAIVSVFFAVAYTFRSSWVYRKVALMAGSAIIAGLSLVWLLERALDVRVLSF